MLIVTLHLVTKTTTGSTLTIAAAILTIGVARPSTINVFTPARLQSKELKKS